MAEFNLDIVHGGTLNLAEGTRLSYNENHIAYHNAHGILYHATQSDKYGIFIPHLIDDNRGKQWFNDLINTYNALQEASQPIILPHVALGRHSLGWTVLVINTPTQTLQNAINAHLSGGYVLKAERLAIKAVRGYLALLDVLHQAEPRKLYHAGLGDWQIIADDEGNPVPALLPFEAFEDASEIAPLHTITHVGNTLLTWFTGKRPSLPLNPFDDTLWQSRHAPYLPEGMVSVGLRYVLMTLLQTPLEKRFMHLNQPSYLPLRETLREWEHLIHQMGGFVDTQTPDALYNWLKTLPTPYQVETNSATASAIWLDLWWRVHLRDTLPHAKRNTQQSARMEALLRARSEITIERDFLDNLRVLLNNGNLNDAQNLTNSLRRDLPQLAQQKDITLWTLWQHLGRWHALLQSGTPAELVSAVGFALHVSPQEDTQETLRQVENSLAPLPNVPRELKQELLLRQSASVLRQNFPHNWSARLNNLQSEIAEVYHQSGMTYLRLPSPAHEDFSVRPFTLIAQMVGQSAEMMSQLHEAIKVGNLPLAQGLIEFGQAITPFVAEHTLLADELKQLGDIVALLSQKNGTSNIVAQAKRGLALLNTSFVNANSALREAIERHILQTSDTAFEVVQVALESKTWEAIQSAYPSYRLLTERSTRHPIEQLRVAHHDTPRTLVMTAILNGYERLYKTYQALLMSAKQNALSSHEEKSLEVQQSEAKAHLTLLQEALELGINMSDVIQADESVRQAWQKMITDALETLSKVERVTEDVSSLRDLIQSDEGVNGQMNALMNELKTLQSQIDGEADAPSVMQQIRALRGQLSEIEHGYQAQLEQNKREMGTISGEMQRQLEAHDIAIQRHNNQIGGANNLIEDARERLSLLEYELIQIQKHESQLLCTYLDAMPQTERLDRISGVLDAIDGLMHALRRCPVEAYDEGCYTAWLSQFTSLKERFETLATRKLNWRDRRNLKNNIRKIRELFTECEAEATAKHEANKLIFTKPANRK